MFKQGQRRAPGLMYHHQKREKKPGTTVFSTIALCKIVQSNVTMIHAVQKYVLHRTCWLFELLSKGTLLRQDGKDGVMKMVKRQKPFDVLQRGFLKNILGERNWKCCSGGHVQTCSD